MRVLKIHLLAVGAVALFGLGASSSAARAEDGGSRVQLSILGGVQNLNKNDTDLPDNFVNIPAGATLSYDFSRNWGAEGEFAWLIPVKQKVDLGTGNQDRKTPNILSYQGSVIAKLPASGTSWSPYVAAGLGAVTFLSNSGVDRVPQLKDPQTSFAINFGAGTNYRVRSHWAVRADYRELAAFPSKDATGLSTGSKADAIWMERGTLGLAYRF